MLEFETYIEQCVVKVLGELDGTAFWVLPEYCLTCYHLLSSKHRPKKVNIEYKGQPFTAEFRPDLSNPEEDLAVLYAGGATGHSAPLGAVQDLDVEVRAHGYRTGFPKAYTVTGILRPGQESDKGFVYNWETNQPAGSSIQGMSGCPVFDPRRMLVIGLTYAKKSGVRASVTSTRLRKSIAAGRTCQRRTPRSRPGSSQA